MIREGDLFDVLPTLAAESLEACVTDPPYGIGFMGREWDTFKPSAMKDTDRFNQVDRLKVASQGSGPSEQRPGQSASLRLPSRTLDSRASGRGTRCERCGGVTEARGWGTTAMACAAEGLDFLLIEREADYIPIIEARIRAIAPLFTETA